MSLQDVRDGDPPTCKTCPYWWPAPDGDAPTGVPTLEEIEEAGAGWPGECHKRAPNAVHHERHGGPLFVSRDSHSLVWPRTEDNEWCGEHPEHAGWLAERMRQ